MAKGDHIYVRRFGGIYAHHGIDIGDGSVIHYTSNDWLSSREICRTSLEKFAGGDVVQVRDYTQFISALEQGGKQSILQRASNQFGSLMDKLRGLNVDDLDFSPEAVVARAESRLGESSFDIVYNNCEHFASWCKTGISSSEQTTELWKAALDRNNFAKYSASKALTNMIEYPWRMLK